MKQIFKSALAAAALMIVTSPIVAAQSRSAYFSDNYNYRFMMNPAMGNEKGFVSLPGAGNLNIAANGNVGLDNFLFVNSQGKTTTFLNPEISASKFLNGLKTNNRLGLDAKVGILAVGFKALKGYNVVSINASADVNFNMPKPFFSLLKQGFENREYKINNLNGNIASHVEVALNHSHQITSGLRVGASVKFLVGLANVDINLQKAHLMLGENTWQAVTNAKIEANLIGLRYKTKWDKDTRHDYVNGIDFKDPGVGGYGMAFDLGAVYELKDWKFSLAFNDLGFIMWKNNVVASTQGDRSFNLNKYVFDPNDMDATFDDMKDDLAMLYQLDDLGNTGERTRGIYATMNAGVEYTLPLYRPLSFGLLNTTHLAGKYTWTDFRLSANIRPVKCLSAAVNYGIGTFGSSFGWVLNLSVPYFNIYAGMDHTLGRLSKQFIPVNPNAQFSFGINIPF